MIIFERLGGWGLGNSLFQIATTLAISKNNNTTFAFPDDCCYRRTRYNSNKPILFKIELPWIDFENFKKFQHYEFWGTGDVGFRNPPITKNNLIIDGFFQTEKYFKHYKNNIEELFELKEEYLEYLQKKYKHLIQDDSCVLHVRRGDYATARELKFLNLNYYQQATEIIGKNKHFIIFSDDIQWCKDNFNFLLQKTFIEENNDLLEMHLMKMFQNHIIANSTFSWWGAWLAKNSKVIMPNPKTNWFSNIYYQERENYNNNYEDMVAENWIVI